MNVFVIIKCGLQDSYNFISQINKLKAVKKTIVFRDSKSLNDDKIEYILPKSKVSSSFRIIEKFFQILTNKKKFDPKIIIGIYEIPHGLLATLAGKILGVPSAVSVIGNPAHTKIRKGFRMLVTMWILKHTNFITVTGNNSKKFLISKNISTEKIYVLPNSLDFSQFKKLNKVAKKYDLISLGRISEEKHIEIFVQIVKAIKAKNIPITAAIAGKGPELNSIKKLVAIHGLEKNIDIKGYLPDEQLENFYNSGRIFVLTSETEGFPRTIIQAAACGTPVVSSNVGDIPDIIEDGVNGQMVSRYDNIKEYVEKIIQLLDNETLSNQFSNKLMKKVYKNFSHECASDVWNKIISKAQMK